MKLFILLICTTAFSFNSGKLFSQQQVTIDSDQEVTINEVFEIIQKQTDYHFLYPSKFFENAPKVHLNKGVIKISELLKKCMAISNASFELTENNKIVIKAKAVPDNNNNEQEHNISGTVVDENGQPLVGANILEKGTSNGTLTDFDGNFTLTLSNENATIVISYVGFLTQEINVEGQSVINATLKVDVASLDEVVVVGYGSQRKSSLISSVAKVDTEDMNKVPSSDVGEMLRGKAAGVIVTTADASPGSSTNILIRGKQSINGGNAPLILIDGVQATSINDVNPNDISSMEILKDAAAQAIYGARASNGVILITTKRGKVGKLQVNYTGYTGLQSVQKHFDTYTGPEFVAYKREANRANGGFTAPFPADSDIFTAAELQTIQDGSYINWEDKILQDAPIMEHNISITAGSEKLQVFSSLQYFRQEGIVRGTKFDRGNIRLNIDYDFNDWLKAGINSTWQISQKDNPGTSTVTNNPDSAMLVRSITTSPLGQIYNDDGSLKLHPSDVQDSWNPLLDLKEITNDTKENRDIMNLFVDISPIQIKGLKYRFNASRTNLNRKNYLFNSSKSLKGTLAGGLGLGSVTYVDNVQWQLENIVNYDTDFGTEKHKLGLTFVQSYLNTKFTNFVNSSTNIPSDAIGIYYMAAGVNQPSITAYERSLVSYVARAQYDFAGKYHIAGSIRADASSVFGANNKWGYFPAVSAGWNIDREDFLEDSKVVNALKIRASYGSVGNEGIQPYQSLSTVVPYDYIFGGTKAAGLLPGSSLPNPDLKWETSTTFNAGVDFGFLEGSRINGTFEFYNTRTKDLLVNRAVPQATGYSRKIVNLGEVENQGVELSLNGDIITKPDFTLSAGIVFNSNRNKILHLYGQDTNGDGIEDDDVANRWFIGQPIDVYYDYQMVGIFNTPEEVAASITPSLQPGDIKVRDVNNNGTLDAEDRVITKQGPDWYGTFTVNMTYKGFDLSGSLYTVQGVTKFNTFLVDYWTGGNPRGILSGIKQDYWTPEHTNGTRPRPLEATGRAFMDQGNVTAGLQDASFVRLQNLTVGYSLPQSILDKLKLNKLRVYLTGQNLFTITDFQAYSPENDARSYPETLLLTAGLQIGL